MECSLRDLRYKEVISVADGSRYGYVGDVEIDLESGQVRTLIIPGQPRFFGLFGRREDIAVRWDEVCRFGEGHYPGGGHRSAPDVRKAGEGRIEAARPVLRTGRAVCAGGSGKIFSLSAQKKVAKPRAL